MRVIHKDIRRALIRRFPYGIFYLLEQDKVIVLAFLHTSRDHKTISNKTIGGPLNIYVFSLKYMLYFCYLHRSFCFCLT